MKLKLLIILGVIFHSTLRGQLTPESVSEVQTVKVYGESYHITRDPGIIGYDFVDYIMEECQKGSEYVEYQVIDSPGDVAKISQNLLEIKNRADCDAKSSSPFFSFLVILEGDSGKIGSFWVQTLNIERTIFIDGCRSYLNKGDLKWLLSMIKHPGIKKPLRKWIRKSGRK